MTSPYDTMAAVPEFTVTSADVTDGAPLPPAQFADGAFHVPNDLRASAYTGAAPPPGTGRHRYYIAVSALDIPSVTALGITPESTPAALSFSILQHTLARAVILPWAGE
jgi:phosphatidylethanolamine-binding protein (PEBP) family uncharacterized protein